MLGQRGARWAKVAVAAFAGAAMAIGVAGPALAESPATGVPTLDRDHVKLILNGKALSQAPIEMVVAGQKVPTFCIDFHTNIALNKKYTEGTWDESQVKNLGKVQWVLTHGYPNADGAKLVDAAGAKMPANVDEIRLDTLLYFGTQTAIWHFSDGMELGDYVAGKGLLDRAQYDVIAKVRTYLVTHAVDQPEPKPTLTITAPKTRSAAVGKKVGPYTVSGPAGEIALSAQGGKAVDADGKALEKTTNGGEFWLTGDKAGTVTATATGNGSVSFGRVFLYKGGRPAQKLILGGSLGEKLTADTNAKFTAGGSAGGSGGETLPLTGAATGTAVGVGLALLAAGAIAVFVVRRRRVRFTA